MLLPWLPHIFEGCVGLSICHSHCSISRYLTCWLCFPTSKCRCNLYLCFCLVWCRLGQQITQNTADAQNAPGYKWFVVILPWWHSVDKSFHIGVPNLGLVQHTDYKRHMNHILWCKKECWCKNHRYWCTFDQCSFLHRFVMARLSQFLSFPQVCNYKLEKSVIKHYCKAMQTWLFFLKPLILQWEVKSSQPTAFSSLLDTPSQV